MGSSRPETLTPVMERVQKERVPSSILDVGAGHGKWGALLREYIDFWNGNIHRDRWHVDIEAVEPYSPYHDSPLYGAYDWVKPVTVQRLLSVKQAPWCWIWMMEVLEHMPHDEGEDVLRKLIPLARHLVVLSTPVHVRAQGPVHGNDLEAHVSHWTERELFELFDEVGGIPPQINVFGNTRLVWWRRTT